MPVKLDNETAKLVKDMLWRGRPQDEISAVTRASQSTISRIKLGQSHSEILWPDGSMGPMPSHAAQPAEVDWSVDAKRYLSFPEQMQERILDAVNSRRISADLPLIPVSSETYSKYLQMDPDEAAFEALDLVTARKAEDDRCAEVMREFDQVVADESAKVRSANIERVIEGTRQEADLSEIRTTPVDDFIYSKLPWHVISERDPSNPIILECASAGYAMMEAACIVLYQLRESPKAWQSTKVHEEIRRLAKKLESMPVLKRRLEEEYKQDG